MAKILPGHVRDFFHRLVDAGVSAYTMQRCNTVLGAIFTTATGLRWELAELRTRDLDLDARMVLELRSAFHPTGGRFLVKDYPKTTSTAHCG